MTALSTNPVPNIFIVDDINQLEPDLVRCFSVVKEFKAPTRDQAVRIIDWHENKNGAKIAKKTKMLLVENRTPPAITSALCKAHAQSRMLCDEQVAFIADYSEAMGVDFNDKPVRPAGKYNYQLLNTDQNLEKITQSILASGRKDFQLLLHGISGTGKSEYAKALADTLGMKVIKKKASDLMSK